MARVDRAAQIVVGLPRRAVDQVEVDVVEARRPGFAGRVERPARRMHPVQHRQHVRGHRLHAQRDPGEAGGAQLVEQSRRRRLRVGLGGDLGVRGQREVLADRVEHRGQPVAAQQRRRAAADEHRVDRAAPSPAARPPGQLGAQRLKPAVGVRAAQLGGRIGVEVAVAAAGRAERHMDIDAERRDARRGTPGRAARRAPFGPSCSQCPRRGFCSP